MNLVIIKNRSLSIGMASGLILLLRNLQSEVLICFPLTCNFGISVSCFCLIGEDKENEE